MAGLLKVPAHYRHSGEDNNGRRRTGPEEGIDNLLLVPGSVLDMDGNQLRDDLNGLRFAFRKQYLHADLGPRGNIWICKIICYAIPPTVFFSFSFFVYVLMRLEKGNKKKIVKDFQTMTYRCVLAIQPGRDHLLLFY